MVGVLHRKGGRGGHCHAPVTGRGQAARIVLTPVLDMNRPAPLTPIARIATLLRVAASAGALPTPPAAQPAPAC